MSLRDRLRERQLPQATVGIRIDWSQRSYVLHRELEMAQMAFDGAAANDSDSLPEAKAALEAARAEVDALYEFLVIKAIPANELEALVSDHPPTEEQKAANDGATFNSKTFFPALLAACVESEEDEESWADLMVSGDLMLNEINVLISTAMQLNDRSPSVALGKGSTTTTS